MKKIIPFTIGLLGCVLLISCNSIGQSNPVAIEIDESEMNELEKPDFYGYVVDKEDGEILVVNYEFVSSIDGPYQAAWLDKMPDDIKVGQEVMVWFDPDSGVSESYPVQTEGEKFSIVTASEPELALLTKQEVVQNALEKNKTQEEENTQEANFPTIASVEYNGDSKLWKVVINNIWGFTASDFPERIIEIKDE